MYRASNGSLLSCLGVYCPAVEGEVRSKVGYEANAVVLVDVTYAEEVLKRTLVSSQKAGRYAEFIYRTKKFAESHCVAAFVSANALFTCWG